MVTTSWPDTQGVPPPEGDLYGSALWLLGRHPQIAELVERVPGAVNVDEHGALALRLEVLVDALRVVDLERAWVRTNPSPSNDDGYRAWLKEGPMGEDVDVPPAARAVARLPIGCQVCLALLASFARPGATLRAADFVWVNESGREYAREFARDWWVAVGMAA